MPRTTQPTAEVAAAPQQPEPPRKRRKAKRTKARQLASLTRVSRNFTQPEPMEQKIGQDHPRAMKSTGPARDSLEPARVEPVGRPVDTEKVAMLAFMNEMVTIYIHPTTDKEAEQVFRIGNNGRSRNFQRGETCTVPRYFVQELGQRKLTTYTQREIVNAEGERVIQQIPHSALMYPFSVRQDNHPRGADWLKTLLESP